jgi:enoyl-CoA hydratase/carnithine racemase
VKHLSKGQAEFVDRRMATYDIIGKSIAGVGIVKMNKEYRNNILTPQYVKQVARGIETMNIDHFVKLIYLTTS